MTWWRIVKQGKILTLPKPKLRIKKPIKEEADKDCKEKLLQYNDKLKSMGQRGGSVQDIYNKFNDHEKSIYREPNAQIKSYTTQMQDIYLNNIEQESAYSEDENEDDRWVVQEEILTTKSKHFEIIPEKVCCEALDMLAQSMSKPTLDGDEKTIGTWTIHIINQENIINPNFIRGVKHELLLKRLILTIEPSTSAPLPIKSIGWVEIGHAIWSPKTIDFDTDWR